MKEPMVQDPIYKKLSSSFMNTLKLNMMQFISHHTLIKSVREDVENLKEKHKTLFDERLFALIMLNMEKKLKEESKLVLRMDKLEEKVNIVEGKLKLMVHEVVRTN